ncbi:hypothetical protein GE09DRAFT_341279 [Coniochaeta sp. 2T2.1]|nr:hypothetical protein GE09DRAFT_341279 [Coniochaeta sp. 2T2.1]
MDASSGTESAPGVLLKVSTSHLILASDRAKRILMGPWREANAVYPDGLRHWDIEGCLDSKALTIVMDIIHGRTRQVPRSLELDMLAKVAVVVDDLQCHEAVEVFSEMWIGEFYLPTQYTRDLVLWICIASVFQRQDLLDSAIQTAILQCTEEFRTLDLPIPSTVVDAIDTERQKLLHRAIMVLDTLFERLCDDGAGCSFACRNALLGALVRQMRSKQLLWPRPSKPFPGLSFASLAADVRCFQSPVLYIPVERDPYAPDEPAKVEEPSFPDFEFGRFKKKGKGRKIYCAECSSAGIVSPGVSVAVDGCRLRDLLEDELCRLEASVKVWALARLEHMPISTPSTTN